MAGVREKELIDEKKEGGKYGVKFKGKMGGRWLKENRKRRKKGKYKVEIKEEIIRFRK